MKLNKTLVLLVAVFGLFLGLKAHPVDLETAKSVAGQFMQTGQLQLSAIYETDQHDVAIYVFNTENGFVMVSANNCETPIIGYSNEGPFDPNNLPIQLQGYLHDFVARIQYGIEHQIHADEITERQWNSIKTTGRLSNLGTTESVPPLLTTQWHQGCLYNSLCPANANQPCGHAEAGCLAVAMGQIMRYWRYPAMGWGSHSYIFAGTTLSADFGSTAYHWNQMPVSLTENSSEAEINAVSTLLYHCGVAVDMKYKSDGSWADPNTAVDAMRRYFNYSRQIHRERQADYDNEAWSLLLKSSLDLSRPILYVGYGSGGHAFVCDGYDADGLFHFNWGWGSADGYFALGNLNPNGNDFNQSNLAILDIIPQYEPCHVYSTVDPSSAGIVEGDGDYHLGELCTLTAIPAADHLFYHWKREGEIVSNDASFTFAVEDDTICLEAVFSCFPVEQITADHSDSSSVLLSWNRADTDWRLMKQFPVKEESGGLATDGEYIYVTYGDWNHPLFSFEKYTMDGVLLDSFNVEGLPRALCIAFDGTVFYANSGYSGYEMLCRVDMEHKRVVDSVHMPIWFDALTYDPRNGGFWLGQNYRTMLYDLQGNRFQTSPMMSDYLNGSGYYTAKDGTPHLLLSSADGVYDYDIDNNVILSHPLLELEDNNSMGACVAEYDGKEAMFLVVDTTVQIYEIRSRMEQILGYRIYRADVEGNAVMLADGIAGSSYEDATWGEASTGVYRFGISEVFGNGNESEILWSEPVVKTNHGLGENEDLSSPSVKKIFENNQIVIIKDGKRYNVAGQLLNE